MKATAIINFVWACVDHVAAFCSLITDNLLLKKMADFVRAIFSPVGTFENSPAIYCREGSWLFGVP